MTDTVLAHALANRDRLLADLADLVAADSVGADPARASGMEAARSLLETRLRDAGWNNLQRLLPDDGTGQPALYADRLDRPGAPTLLVYAHYDVQPPEPHDSWHSPPFELTAREGRLYGRGASDDKGPMLIALAALDAFLAVDGQLPVNVKLLLEGEEETGSPSLPGILEAHRDLLSADAALSADGARWRADLVSVNTGSRGSAGFEITVRTAGKDLHSGRYGGVVPNALHVMAQLVASLHNPDGGIAVPAVLAPVTEMTEAERAEMAEIPFNEAAFLAPTGAMGFGEPGMGLLERLWYRPTIELNGMWGGHTGAGSKTVIPHEAHAKLTLRLVPGQDPKATMLAVQDHLRARIPDGVALEFHGVRGLSAASALPGDHPLLLASEAALEATTGVRPVRVRIGATLPLTEIIRRILGIDTVMFSFSTADEDYHAPNEFLRESAIDEGLAAWVDILARVGRQSAEDYRRTGGPE
ncbi:M20/M25/M40 family metallo-hydrolase [Primorskyibacter flagellatus]|uniref:M20/M25/M40 family metallo-hydrolase n=1 Tax=Primorskyibacter flagellatus TaxID=1387277 RepID=UPI00166F0F3C|nr:M20/M25/M40 family metallo-hydrolase [Primorskyibacter flagellatus]